MNDDVTLVHLTDSGPVGAGTTAEIRALIVDTIRATYPARAAETAAAKTVGDGRLARLLGEREIFAAYRNGRLVGVAAVHLTGEAPEQAAYLSTCFVAERGQGIGRALTAARIGWARDHGAVRVEATTHPWNRASRANLHAAGLEPAGETPDGWLGHGTIIAYAGPVAAVA